MVQAKDAAPRRFSGMLTLNALGKPPLVPSNGPKRAKRRPQRGALSERLFRDFPKAFKYPPVPLAVGIGLKLRELLGAEFKPGGHHSLLTGLDLRAALPQGRCSRRDAAQSRRLSGGATRVAASRRCARAAERDEAFWWLANFHLLNADRHEPTSTF